MAPCRPGRGEPLPSAAVSSPCGADHVTRPSTTRSTSTPPPPISVSIMCPSDELAYAPPRLVPASPAGIPQLRSCRTGPSVGAVNPAAAGYNGNLMAAGAIAFSEMRLRRSRTVSGNSNASTSSSSSRSSYVPTTGSSASFPLPPAIPGTTLRGCTFSQDTDDEMDGSRLSGDDDNDDDDDTSSDASGGHNNRPSDEFRGALQHVTAPALPPAPYPVDPYHFYCILSARIEQVAAAIAELLAASDIESSFHPYKCKFRCVKYVHYSHVEFIVRVYAHSNALLVEFQRRTGSVLLWDGLYHSLYHQLAHLVDFTAPACPQSGGQKRVAPASGLDDDRNLGVQIWQTLTTVPNASAVTPSSGVEAMKLMLTSKYVDAQREGCAALAVLTENPQNAVLVAKFQLVEPLTRASEARDADMARSATGALSNIARALRSFPDGNDDDEEMADDDLKATVMHHLRRAAGIVLTRLEQRSSQEWSLYALELLRESARACGAFITTGIVETSEYERTAQVLKHYVLHRDRQLAVLCRDAMEKLDELRRASS